MKIEAAPYDIDLYEPCPLPPDPREFPELATMSAKSIGPLGLSLTLDRARSIRHALELGGGAVVVIPARYANPKVGQAQARAIAEQAYRRLVASSADPIGPLQPGRPDSHFWQFIAENLRDQELGREPGVHFFSVDKDDGHLWGQADFAWASEIDDRTSTPK